jgi:hypothetical protein
LHVAIPCSSTRRGAEYELLLFCVDSVLIAFLVEYTIVNMLLFILFPSNWRRLANAGDMPATTLGNTF